MFSQKTFKSSGDVRGFGANVPVRFSFGEKNVSAVASTEVQGWLEALGGGARKRVVLIGNILERLRKVNPRYWYSAKSAGRIERFLQLRQHPKPEEVEDMRIAAALFAPELMQKNVAYNEALAEDLRDFIAMAIQSDPQVYGARVAAARELVGALRDLVRMEGS